MNSTTVEYGHLSPKAQEYLDLPTKDRIRKIQEGTWLQLDHATTTLQKLEDLLDYPKVTRMPSYLIVGPSYSGKTSGLHYPEMMQAIYMKSESTLGDIFDLVKTAAVDAIRSGEEAITEKQLEALDWVPPSKRKTYRRRL